MCVCPRVCARAIVNCMDNDWFGLSCGLLCGYVTDGTSCATDVTLALSMTRHFGTLNISSVVTLVGG